MATAELCPGAILGFLSPMWPLGARIILRIPWITFQAQRTLCSVPSPHSVAIIIMFSIGLMGYQYFAPVIPKFLFTIADAALDGLLPSLCKVLVWECDGTELNQSTYLYLLTSGLSWSSSMAQNRFLQLVHFIQAIYLH